MPLGLAALLAFGLSTSVSAAATSSRAAGATPLPAFAPQVMPPVVDTPFSDDGKQTTDFDGGQDSGYGVAVQPDGKTVVVGRVSGATDDFAVARYDLDGSLDTTFSDDGKQSTDFADGRDVALAVALQTDGKVLVVGKGSGGFGLARYESDGTLDPTFGTNGTQVTALGGADSTANGVTLQADGKIVVAGYDYNINDDSYRFALARYEPNGTLDATFGTGGTQITDVTASDDYAFSVAMQADQKILVGGDGSSQFALVRYNPDGSLDGSFSGDGMQVDRIDDFATLRDLVVQPDGKIAAAGSSGLIDSGDSAFAVARYDADGTLDTTFSGDGIATTRISGSSLNGLGLALQSDQKLVIAGGGGTQDFAVARYDTAGALDTTFSGDGIATTDFGSYEVARAAAIGSDQKIALAGFTSTNGGDLAVARYRPDGSLDVAPPPAACADGVDNDSDGSVDFPADPGCTAATDDTENPNPPVPTTPPAAPETSCTITGTSGDDVIHGTDGDDVICARGGNDVVYGRGGDDLVHGDAGDDVLLGGAGDDALDGARGRDRLVGGGGADVLRGGPRPDRLDARDAVRRDDAAYGGAGNDSCRTDRGDLRRSC